MDKVCTIDPEFQALIPPLRKDEYDALAASIAADGCMHPIVTWNGLIVDGHNRYEICNRIGASYRTVEKQFSDRQHVMVWMLGHQLARRNLTNYTRGVMAIKHKQLIAARGHPGKRSDLLSKSSTGSGLNTRTELAKLAGVSPTTIGVIEQIERSAAPEIKQAAHNGDISINTAAKLAALPQHEQHAAAAAGLAGMKAKIKEVIAAARAHRANENPVADDLMTLKAEIARLQTENTELKSYLSAAEDEINRLRAEHDVQRGNASIEDCSWSLIG